MPNHQPIPIPPEFDAASVEEKRAYLSQVRARVAESIGADPVAAEEALFEVIRRRRDELTAHPERGLSLEQLMGPLRRKYSDS